MSKRGKTEVPFYGFWPDGEKGKAKGDLPKSVYCAVNKGIVLGYRLSDGLRFNLEAVASFFVPCKPHEIYRYLTHVSVPWTESALGSVLHRVISEDVKDARSSCLMPLTRDCKHKEKFLLRGIEGEGQAIFSKI